jgi:hypothetical protein
MALWITKCTTFEGGMSLDDYGRRTYSNIIKIRIKLYLCQQIYGAFENCAPLGHYAANSGNFLSTFQDNLTVPSSTEKPSKWDI